MSITSFNLENRKINKVLHIFQDYIISVGAITISGSGISVLKISDPLNDMKRSYVEVACITTVKTIIV